MRQHTGARFGGTMCGMGSSCEAVLSPLMEGGRPRGKDLSFGGVRSDCKMKMRKHGHVTERTDEPGATGWFGIARPDVFLAVLKHERCRSDRDGSTFCLVVFGVSDLVSDRKGMRLFAEGIKRSMRSIDEMGWMDRQSIGVLLPVTGSDGGKQFVSRASGSRACTLYTYPDHWLPGGVDRECDDDKDGDRDRDRDGDAIKKVFSLEVPLWKTGLDIVGAIGALLVTSPLFIFMTVYIMLFSPGRIFFTQKRVGQHGRFFTFIKFRTMHENNDSGAHREYLRDLIKSGRPMEKLDTDRDPRIIPGGKIIRKMCIDELPQLFNVLKRDMSLVGPRPCIPYEATEYLRWHSRRFDTLPGMTGLWQVNGKNKLSFEQMIRYDIAYAERMSLANDLRILLRTPVAIAKMVIEAGRNRIRGGGPSTAAMEVVQGAGDRAVRDA
jgi:lipopolysaccharide/colanic/teichoic acid biosynthesis glycosyltransferase